MGYTKYLQKAKYLVKQKNGVLNLVKRALAFVIRPIFSSEKYYLVNYNLAAANENTVTIKGDITNTGVIMVKNNDEFEKLISGNQNYQSFFTENIFMENYFQKFGTGALLFVLVDLKENEIVCSNWVALEQKAFESMNTSRYTVDFRKDAYNGGWYTNPKYRGLGYNKYLNLETSKYLVSIGKTGSKCAISKNNASSLRSAKALGAEIYGETKYLKILFYKRWKEQLLPQGCA
jgi:hypothetical protein